jgi:hypothetical protein
MKNLIMDKVLMFNAGITALTFTEIESLLKIVLLIMSITYTIIKIIYNKDDNSDLEKQIKKYFQKKDDKDLDR